MPASIIVRVCEGCDVPEDVHTLDGCRTPEYVRVRVCSGCYAVEGEDCVCG
jgi:hypothetical protein